MEFGNLNPNIAKVMTAMQMLKRDFIKGKFTRVDVARQINALLHYYNLISPDAVVDTADVPEVFFQPCDCVFCRAEAGESPIPLEGVAMVENARLAYRLGMISKLDAMLETQKIFRAYNVNEADAIKFWQVVPVSPDPCHTQASVPPLAAEEVEFFKGLEEQLKVIPKEGE